MAEVAKGWDQEVAQTTAPRLSTRTGLIYVISRELDMSMVDADHPFGLDVYNGPQSIPHRRDCWKKLAVLTPCMTAFTRVSG